jgi:hypothetical protein
MLGDTQTGKVGGGGALLIVRLKTAVPVPLVLIAPIVTLALPAVVGVPEIRPFDVLTASPAGRDVALKLVGLLLAVIW